MGVGHVALALGASKAAPRLNVGLLIFAALLADFLLGIFASLGLEHASVPDNFPARHYLLFTFPYSHSLLALIVWATIFGFLISRAYGPDAKRIWLVVGLVVLSHFVLDGLVHVVGLPLLGENSPKVGFGLWKYMPAELTLETVMAIAGLAVYWTIGGAGTSVVARYGIAALTMLFTAITWTQLGLVAPPKARALEISWIVVPVLLSVVAYFLDRPRLCGEARA